MPKVSCITNSAGVASICIIWVRIGAGICLKSNATLTFSEQTFGRLVSSLTHLSATAKVFSVKSWKNTLGYFKYAFDKSVSYFCFVRNLWFPNATIFLRHSPSTTEALKIRSKKVSQFYGVNQHSTPLRAMFTRSNTVLALYTSVVLYSAVGETTHQFSENFQPSNCSTTTAKKLLQDFLFCLLACTLSTDWNNRYRCPSIRWTDLVGKSRLVTGRNHGKVQPHKNRQLQGGEAMYSGASVAPLTDRLRWMGLVAANGRKGFFFWKGCKWKPLSEMMWFWVYFGKLKYSF